MSCLKLPETWYPGRDTASIPKTGYLYAMGEVGSKDRVVTSEPTTQLADLLNITPSNDHSFIVRVSEKQLAGSEKCLYSWDSVFGFWRKII